MKLTKEQREARRQNIQQASLAAIRAHFTGDGAAVRRWLFLRDGLFNSVGWVAMLLCLASWVVVAGLLLGPEHDYFLKQVHSWMVETPADQVLERSHAAFVSVAWECVQLSLVLGFGQKLFTVVKPAQDAAKQRFTESMV